MMLRVWFKILGIWEIRNFQTEKWIIGEQWSFRSFRIGGFSSSWPRIVETVHSNDLTSLARITLYIIYYFRRYLLLYIRLSDTHHTVLAFDLGRGEWKRSWKRFVIYHRGGGAFKRRDLIRPIPLNLLYKVKHCEFLFIYRMSDTGKHCCLPCTYCLCCRCTTLRA